MQRVCPHPLHRIPNCSLVSVCRTNQGFIRKEVRLENQETLLEGHKGDPKDHTQCPTTVLRVAQRDTDASNRVSVSPTRYFVLDNKNLTEKVRIQEILVKLKIIFC